MLLAAPACGLVTMSRQGPLRRVLLRRRATVQKSSDDAPPLKVHFLHEDVDRDLDSHLSSHTPPWFAERHAETRNGHVEPADDDRTVVEKRWKDPLSWYASYLRELWVAESTFATQRELTRKRRVAPKKATAKKDLASRVRTGLACGVVFSAWVFSSNALFALGMALQACVAQLEYFRMAIASGAAPARRIVLCSSAAMLCAACVAPTTHELVFPVAGTWIMLWLLLMRPNCSSINDISTTLMGLFYTAYLPSWWVRLRCSPVWSGPPPLATDSTVLASLMAPHASAAVATWWTCLGVAASDIGAYFGGKALGRHTLKAIGLGAAAEASPNKTIEGALSGFLASALVATLGAFAMRWPCPYLVGPAYGLLVSMVALVGDLTASMLKRDGAVKDFGSLLPGHGGLLDRLDGFIFVAPVAFILLPPLCGLL